MGEREEEEGGWVGGWVGFSPGSTMARARSGQPATAQARTKLMNVNTLGSRPLLCLFGWVGGWMGGWVGWMEKEAVRMSCCMS